MSDWYNLPQEDKYKNVKTVINMYKISFTSIHIEGIFEKIVFADNDLDARAQAHVEINGLQSIVGCEKVESTEVHK
jgi:hypothetical protein